MNHSFDFEDSIENDNAELISESDSNPENSNIIVYSRDWTVETVIKQIDNGNIDLNPKFQRRNAWNDKKKSQLIESYILGYPVPEVVLAEHPFEKKKFIVIDGKQRLITLYGFISQSSEKTWKRDKLTGVDRIKRIQGMSYQDLKNNPDTQHYARQLENSDVRCTVISNVKDTNILYDIFYRLNVGASPLSVQELRQVIYKGPFIEFLIDYTSKPCGIHNVLNINEPDNRFKDTETLLRVVAFLTNINSYKGNLKIFIDNFTQESNEYWDMSNAEILNKIKLFEDSILELTRLLGSPNKIGRKIKPDLSGFESRFNTVLFEVQIFYAAKSLEMGVTIQNGDFIECQRKLFLNSEFTASISSTTKSIEQYSNRYNIYSSTLKDTCGVGIKSPWM